MSPAPLCPCCAYPLLRHIRSRGAYWFCSHCYQEMPVLDSISTMESSLDSVPVIKLPEFELFEAIVLLSSTGSASASESSRMGHLFNTVVQ